jgi:hypothetical protein
MGVPKQTVAAAELTSMTPLGDLILSLQQGEKQIRVSSEVLIAASPVFEAMLIPHCTKGQELTKIQSVPFPSVRLLQAYIEILME